MNCVYTRHLTVLAPAMIAVVLVLGCPATTQAQIVPPASAEELTDHQLDVASFEYVWQTIRDTHWQTMPGGLDWQAIRTEFEPRIAAATTRDQVRDLLSEMVGRIGQTHFSVFPASVYTSLTPRSRGAYVTGIDIRIVDSQALVTEVMATSPAAAAGVQVGWILLEVNEQSVEELIALIHTQPQLQNLQLGMVLHTVLLQRLRGAPGSRVMATFLDHENNTVSLELDVTAPRGAIDQLGNLLPMPIWYEEQRFGSTTYVRFNAFRDLPRILSSFQKSVETCDPCAGLIIDLRGNGGGIGAMAAGMAGFLISEPNQPLGTMHTRDNSVDLVVNPRANPTDAPVAILIDVTSASTAEIFAGGLQALGRARVFGTRSAGATLSSVIERLPNGDGFQHAIANYVSAGGQELEGNGVTPDVVVELSRKALLQGIDPVLTAARNWIATQQ